MVEIKVYRAEGEIMQNYSDKYNNTLNLKSVANTKNGQEAGFNAKGEATSPIQGAFNRENIAVSKEQSNVIQMPINNLSYVTIIKKDGTQEEYNIQKVVNAVKKSAGRMMITFSDDEINQICALVDAKVMAMGKKEVQILDMHNIVESVLEAVNPKVAQSYRNYRNYKQDFVSMLDKVYQESQKIMYIGDKENSNSDSALVSTKRSLVFNQLNKELYKKFFLTVEDLQAVRDGYIYIHDMSARRDTMNCCLFDVTEVLKGGFEMGNLWYNEPKSLDVAFDVIGDIVMSAASQQYGGFTVPEVDKILAPYAEKTYKKEFERYISLGLPFEKADEEATKDVQNDFEQGFQGWEYKFNTVASSRGDYPFITITLGLGTGKYEKMASIAALKIRMNGQYFGSAYQFTASFPSALKIELFTIPVLWLKNAYTM